MQHLHPHLEKKFSRFLPQLRLGIDIGEWAGGIAVVRRGEILHAETYTDYHGTTLEKRRQLRRGRRTRHAKKMRLARLRSWVLRQELPDPYHLMRRKEFQCQPGEFNVGRKKLKSVTGKKKDDLGSWVEAVQDGHRTDPDAFVIALTQLFQKRGFKWEGSDLQEMTDKELAEELDETEGVRITPSLAEQIKAEIQRRQVNPQQEYEGRIKDLDGLLQKALGRKREPRTPEHRSIIEGDLRRLVEAYTSRHCPDNAGGWTKALLRLLNKRVRKLRFENRVLSGCSWCGKNTPKKSGSQIRELAYRAAVMNLRADAANSRRPLSDAERKYFLDIWERRKSDRPPSPETIKKKLLALRSQTEMAKQLWELLASPAPAGRTNLCLQHLKMQAEGAFLCSGHYAICKQSSDDPGKHILQERVRNVGPAIRGAPNPCREAHDERVIQRIERILFNSNGAPRFGAAPALITIEFPKPNTAQSYSCPSCNEKLAIDLRVRYRLRDVKAVKAEPCEEVLKFTCPACDVVVQVKAARQLTIRGVRRRIPVTLKNTDAFLRKAKGGMKDKKIQTYLRETRNSCVYCGLTIDRSTIEIDHIFPKSKSNPGIDSNLVACCQNCNNSRTGKGDRTPWRWKGEADRQWWQEFERRVRKLPLPMRKQRILLSADEFYPENPTALARAGARPRAFIEELKKMLGRHSVERDQIADNYEEGKLVIQTIDGWMTSQLRRSWVVDRDGTPNFPEKNVWDLHNHAQDAALIAACPPHTWRERIFAFGEHGDQAPKELAPNWGAFLAGQHVKKPIVTVLGNYDVNWRKQFANTEFWRDPLGEHTKPIKGELLKNLKAYQAENIKWPTLQEEFKAVCEKYAIKGRSNLPAEALAELQERIKNRKFESAKVGRARRSWNKHHSEKQSRMSETPAELQERLKTENDVRRVQYKTHGSGKPFVIRPSDGPPRMTEAQPAAEGVIIWLKKGKTLEEAKDRDLVISVVRPSPLQQFDVPKEDPPLEEGVQRWGPWRRNDFVRLPANGRHREGWYRLTKFEDDGISALPERAIPNELVKRMRLKDDDKARELPSQERKLVKRELLPYLKRGLLSEVSHATRPDSA